MARSQPNVHGMVSRWAHIRDVLKVKVNVKGHVIRALLCRARKSLLLPGKWPDSYQTCTRWSPYEPVSRVCSRSRSRSKVTWYGHFCAGLKSASSRRQMVRLRKKLADDGLQVRLHPDGAQSQGQGQRSRDTGTFVLDLKSLLFVGKWSIATKLAHDGLQVSLHPGCDQGQG